MAKNMLQNGDKSANVKILTIHKCLIFRMLFNKYRLMSPLNDVINDIQWR